jgi:hypothetical protein
MRFRSGISTGTDDNVPVRRRRWTGRGRRTTAAAGALALAGALYLGLVPAAPASAQTAPAPVTKVLNADVVVTTPVHEVVILTQDITVKQGEARRVIAQQTARLSPGVTRAGVDNLVAARCVVPPPPGSPDTGTAVGPSGYAETGLSPTQTTTLRPTLLFVAEQAGTYQCQLVVQVGDDPPGESMIVLAGQTYLTVSSADEVGAQWWHNPPCDSPGTFPTCTYLGDPGGQTSTYVFYTDGSPQAPWTAAEGATLASATANVEVTTCRHTASCNGRRAEGEGTNVSSRLEVIQLNAAGRTCNVTTSLTQGDFVSYVPHHYNIPYELDNIPILPACGSRQFIVRVLVTWVSGNPLKIDSGGLPTVYTGAFIVNSAFSPPKPAVPNLIGMSESAANEALRVAGLTHFQPVYVPGSPADKVISQDPPAGRVVDPGTPVLLTITTPGVKVPSVMFQTKAAATTTLEGLGLVVTSHNVRDCSAPGGKVGDQAPPPATRSYRAAPPWTSPSTSVPRAAATKP